MTREEALENKKIVQQTAVSNWILNNHVGTIEGATGIGKSKIFLDCLEYLRREEKVPPKTLLIVPTEGMRDIDWPDEFDKWGVSQEGVKKICYASLSRVKLENYDFICYDEYHNLTVPNLLKLQTLLQYKQMKVLGLTATLPKQADWPSEVERVHLLRTLVPSVYKITTDEAVDLGLIADFEVHVLKFELDSKNLNIETGGKTKYKTTEKSQYLYLTKQLQKAMYGKNENLKFMAMSKRTQFIYNLPSKYRLAKQVMEKLNIEGKRTLLMAGSIEQANLLCGQDVYHSESNQDALDRFQAKSINFLGAVKALDEGRNLVDLDQLLILQVTSGERRLIQKIGRCVRYREDHKALIVILVTLDTADEKWYEKAIAGFETSRITVTHVKVPEL